MHSLTIFYNTQCVFIRIGYYFACFTARLLRAGYPPTTQRMIGQEDTFIVRCSLVEFPQSFINTMDL